MEKLSSVVNRLIKVAYKADLNNNFNQADGITYTLIRLAGAEDDQAWMQALQLVKDMNAKNPNPPVETTTPAEARRRMVEIYSKGTPLSDWQREEVKFLQSILDKDKHHLENELKTDEELTDGNSFDPFDTDESLYHPEVGYTEGKRIPIIELPDNQFPYNVPVDIEK